ncbi:hypothetical protein CH373_09310 [Leptospira perolatii]|uniref:Uncharacterized protein n=1 Tax=Leptospira perolatii TaxID=2023191 RepID=A0A2M9ZM62_9LEPT|nr:hypothetical protein [Leptospira perolatii]PJZ68483.1 hypothetical protein CH360_15810 [Leptospira perolatii]PJZ73180.1 hypothetical protein CH373_09310 [Leptospira perolatii]
MEKHREEGLQEESVTQEEDLQEELRFFLETRLEGLLEEAEELRKSRRKRSPFSVQSQRRQEKEQMQGSLPFLCLISQENAKEQSGETQKQVNGDTGT